MKRIVSAFNTITGHEILELEGWLFMALVKMVRITTDPGNRDHYVDGAAHFALAGEAASAQPQTEGN